MSASINKWRAYAQLLCQESTDIDANNRPFAFISSYNEFHDEKYQDFDGGFIFWADTENQLTTIEADTGSGNPNVILNTAFNVMKRAEDDTQKETIYNQCEQVAWKFIQRMKNDIVPHNETCPDLIHFYSEQVQMDREGPYANNHYGILARIRIKIRNVIPEYDADQWTAS